VTEPTTAPAPRIPVPSQEEIDAALRTLMRAWAPSIPLPGDPDPVDDEDYHDPYDGCGCAGDDEDGGPRGCNCGPGCSCEMCDYFDYARYKSCWARHEGEGSACTAEPRFRVLAYRLQTTHVTERVADGASCPHPVGDESHRCSDGVVWHEAGQKEQEYWFRPACSVSHAKALIADSRKPDAYGNPDDFQYRIERWAYAPHDTELPAPLPDVRERIQAADSAVKFVIDALKRPPAGIGVWMAAVREHIACAAWNAARPLARPGEDDDQADDEPATPPQEEPADPWGEDDHAASDPEDVFDYAMDREPIDGHDSDPDGEQ
jgi:hypothetical protein